MLRATSAPTGAPSPAGRRLRPAWALAILAVLALVGGGIVLAIRSSSIPRPEERAAATDPKAPAPTAQPAPAVEPKPTPAESPPPAKPPLPRGNLKQVASGLVDTGSNLYSAYRHFLGQKTGRGGKLTPADQELKKEIGRFEDVADSLHYATAGGFYAGLRRLRGENARETHRKIGQRIAELKQAERKVEPLMERVQPNTQVRRLWRQIRQQVQQAEELAQR